MFRLDFVLEPSTSKVQVLSFEVDNLNEEGFTLEYTFYFLLRMWTNSLEIHQHLHEFLARFKEWVVIKWLGIHLCHFALCSRLTHYLLFLLFFRYLRSWFLYLLDLNLFLILCKSLLLSQFTVDIISWREISTKQSIIRESFLSSLVDFNRGNLEILAPGLKFQWSSPLQRGHSLELAIASQHSVDDWNLKAPGHLWCFLRREDEHTAWSFK